MQVTKEKGFNSYYFLISELGDEWCHALATLYSLADIPQLPVYHMANNKIHFSTAMIKDCIEKFAFTLGIQCTRTNALT
jgi:hypothetical protein